MSPKKLRGKLLMEVNATTVSGLIKKLEAMKETYGDWPIVLNEGRQELVDYFRIEPRTLGRVKDGFGGTEEKDFGIEEDLKDFIPSFDYPTPQKSIVINW